MNILKIKDFLLSFKFCVAYVLFIIVSYLGDDIVKKIEVGFFKDIYVTIINFCPSFNNMVKEYIHWFILSFFVYVYFVYKHFMRKEYVIISEKSMGHKLSNVVIKNYEDRCTLSETIDISYDMLNDNIIQAVKKQDEFIEEIIKKYHSLNLGYYGIAHTPLVFRAGYQVGDQDNVHLYHKCRSNDSEFIEWSEELGLFKINIEFCDEPKEYIYEKQEMIVAIGTSFEIKKSEITKLNPEKKHLMFFKANIIDFDNIKSYKDAEQARKFIWSNVRNYVKKYNIQKIHLLIASSVAFTFFLGMGYSRQHDPECVVYHYERPDYKWGINIKKGSDECFVEL